MASRISYSLLDPWVTTPLRRLYSWLPLPAWLPPEAIVACGHLSAIAGAVGLGYSSRTWWGGLLAAAGVAGNHLCDVLDGTHARATRQCRNGGELLDHFVDPLSMAYWVTGLAGAASVAAPSAPWLGVAGLIVLLAQAVLTNLLAKMTGEFVLARFGPTELKSLLVVIGLAQGVRFDPGQPAVNGALPWWLLATLTVIGAVQIVLGVPRAVRNVNDRGAAPADQSEWVAGSPDRTH